MKTYANKLIILTCFLITTACQSKGPEQIFAEKMEKSLTQEHPSYYALYESYLDDDLNRKEEIQEKILTSCNLQENYDSLTMAEKNEADRTMRNNRQKLQLSLLAYYGKEKIQAVFAQENYPKLNAQDVAVISETIMEVGTNSYCP